MLGDDPPYLSVGTEVSAKYKGAFCEAKIRKVVRSVKCRVTYKQALGTATVTDDQIKGTLRVGATVEARHNDKKEFVEATITKIQDCSQYTVVFDDGDITTLRRTALCLKSGRHFAESETLDQLPLTHPEHFGNPVIGGRRGRRSRQTHEDSSDDDDDVPRGSNDSGSTCGGKDGRETEPEIGRVVCVELGDKKKKDNWFPGLVVAPTAQDTVRIRVRDDYLVRSFKDARYYTVPKKEATEFTKDLVNKIENSALKVAVEKAVIFLEKNELPPHWDQDLLFGHVLSSGNSDSDAELDSDSSDDEPREEKDHFVAQLYKFMDDRGTPINNCPMIGNEDIDLYRLFRAVYKLGGYNRVTNQNQWKAITRRLNFSMQNTSSTHNLVKQSYKKFLHSFEDFYRKLGCTMVNHPRGGIRKPRPGRSLIRDKDRNTPVPTQDKTIKLEKDDDEKEKKIVDDEIKKEKREIKKEPVVKEEEIQPTKVKRKEEPAEESASGQESDVNIDAEEESSSSEKSQKSLARLTPSSSVSNKSKASAAKSKEEPAKKKPAPERKKPEVKKQEKKDEKVKEEDNAKTRSKGKDDVVVKGAKSNAETRETRAPSRESDKKSFTKQRRLTDDELKKRGRKKKEAESETKGKAPPEDKNIEYASCYKGPIELHDRLKVYYGPTHESKVTYEAKVIDMDKVGAETLYLVHYTGWNTRYDEWIKASRIAQNCTQAQGRQKRTKATPRPQTPNAGSSKSTRTAPNAGTGAGTSAQSRRRAASVAPPGAANAREGTPATRSTTPSPHTPSVSRTKSPASSTGRSTRVTRNADSSTNANELGRRARRASGHADSIRESDSEESETLDSDVSTDTRQVQLRATRVRGGVQERSRREARKRAESRMKVEETSDGETEKDAEEPRRGRRVRKLVSKMEEVKSEPESDEEQPKGRDFDLNQIRSELKGFDKAVKLDMASVDADQEDDDEDSKPLVAVKQEKPEPESEKKASAESDKKRETPKQEPQNASPSKREAIKVEAIPSESTEDIYEFKEPEPFEFEVRNKRDSGGSGGAAEKEKDAEKEKVKKRVFEEDQKSPKKRQKTVNAAAATPATKVEAKPESNPTESADSKKKSRKIFKKSEEADELDTESDEVASKFYSSNYSNVTVYKRKAGTPVRAVEEAVDEAAKSASEAKKMVAAAAAAEEESKSPKKRQPKTFGPAAAAKTNDSKAEAAPETDGKKKVRKIFVKKADEAEENDGAAGKETPKSLPASSYGTSKTAPRKEAHETDENSIDKSKKLAEDDASRNLKKPHKTYRNTPTKAETNAAEVADTKKKLVRRIPMKKVGGESEDADDSVSNEVEEPATMTRDHSKYYSYSGPKAKAAALMNENDSLQDRLAASKSEAQPSESAKVFVITATPVNASKDDAKLKTVESLMSLAATTPTTSGTKQASADKKRGPSDPGQVAKLDPKQETKTLDFTPVVPHSLPVPAPISTRLPATASIEEKLSAAAAFRSKAKEAKKEEEPEPAIQRKPPVAKKPETTTTPKKAKEEAKVKHEPEKKKQQAPSEQSITTKKDPLQEIEIRKDPLLEVVTKKGEEAAAAAAAKVASTIPMVTAVTKTYGAPKKDTTSGGGSSSKIVEEGWKKAKIEQVSCELANNEPAKDYVALRKETIVSKMKSSIDRDSIDSTDSSDSERRLTIIDSEDFADDKNESSSDGKATVKLVAPALVASQEHRPSALAEAKQASSAASCITMMQQPKSSGGGGGGKVEEDGENLNSLLCEEEIPGSPTPGAEVSDQEHRAGNAAQNILKTDMRSKMAVAFVAAQLPISTLPSSSQLANCTIVTTMSSSSSSNVAISPSTSGNILTTIPIAVQHSSIQSIRQAHPQQSIHLQQHPILPHPQMQQQHRPLHQHLLQQQHQQQQQQQLQQLHQQQQQQHPQQRHEHQVSMAVAVQRRESNEAAPVMDNTPPTTPDSTISNLSGSPRDERTGGSTPSSSEDNSKLNRDSSEAENDSAGGKGPGLSEDDGSLVNCEIGGSGATGSSSDRIPKPPAKRLASDGESVSPKKRRKRKDQDGLALSGQNSMSGKKSPRQSGRNARHGTTGSDSDDTSEGSNQFVNNTAIPSNSLSSPAVITQAMNNNMSMAAMTAAGLDLGSFSPNRQAKFNFLIDLDPNLDGNQKISVLQNRIGELRKAYLSVKSELSTIERRRKKLKRRKREAQKAAKAEMQQACS